MSETETLARCLTDPEWVTKTILPHIDMGAMKKIESEYSRDFLDDGNANSPVCKTEFLSERGISLGKFKLSYPIPPTFDKPKKNEYSDIVEVFILEKGNILLSQSYDRAWDAGKSLGPYDQYGHVRGRNVSPANRDSIAPYLNQIVQAIDRIVEDGCRSEAL